MQVDYTLYDNRGVDAFVIGFNEAGYVQSVEPMVLRTTLYRT